MKIEKLYKIRAWVNRTMRGGRIEQKWYKESVYTKLSGAKLFYASMVNRVEVDTSCYYKYSGKVELFIPHVWDTGELAYWPDDEKYIAKYDSEEDQR